VKKQFEPPMNADSFVGFFIGVRRVRQEKPG
jgi:hypothetical protein